MIDIKLLMSENSHNIIKNIQLKNHNINFKKLILLLKEQKKLKNSLNNLQKKKNILSKQYFVSNNFVKNEINTLNINLVSLKDKLFILNKEIKIIIDIIPNTPCNDTIKINDNKIIKIWGTKKNFAFNIKDHLEIGNKIQELDFKLAAKITGSKFSIIQGNLAKLKRSLINFMLDVHVEKHNYQEVIVPLLVNNNSLYSSGHLPKFKNQLFYTNDKFNFGLIPTAEVPLTNIVRDTTINYKNLPLKYVSYTECFRKEAGTYSKNNKGLIRKHQFGKVELVQITALNNSIDAFYEMVSHVEIILQKLELPYRVIQLPPSELSFSACRTYDVEVWIPSQNSYIEVSSCSWCSDFQSRRMNAKFKNSNSKTQYLHTLNASGVALSRTLVAILENYQEKNHIKIPTILKKYMNIDKIYFKI